MKLLPIEEKFVAILARTALWFDVKWGKGTLFVFFCFSFIIPTVFGFLCTFLIFIVLHKWFLYPLLLGVFTLFENVIMVFLSSRLSGINFFEEVEYFPNPNRENGYLFYVRCFILIFLLHVVYMFLFVKEHQGYYSATVMLSLIALDTAFTFSALYVLCVDPYFPDEEEESKKLENEPVLSAG